MNFWESQAGFEAFERLIMAINDLTDEVKELESAVLELKNKEKGGDK